MRFEMYRLAVDRGISKQHRCVLLMDEPQLVSGCMAQKCNINFDRNVWKWLALVVMRSYLQWCCKSGILVVINLQRYSEYPYVMIMSELA